MRDRDAVTASASLCDGHASYSRLSRSYRRHSPASCRRRQPVHLLKSIVS